MSRDLRGEVLLIALFAVIVCFQLFVPPSLGMADNGDYGRLIGRFALGPWHPDPSDQYSYLTTAWIYERQYLWVSDNFSSELFPINAAVLIGWLFNSYHFDIQLVGAIHALVWIGCFAALVVALRPMPGWARWATAIFALFIFTDANYVAFCNSFYMDASAFLFLGWAVVLWLLIITSENPSLRLFLGFSVTSGLCAMSKSQHAPLGLFLFLLGLVAAFSYHRAQRRSAFAIALIVLLGAFAGYASMPAADARMPQYAVVFLKILQRSPAPAADLSELGLGPDYLRYVGHDRSPLSDVSAEEAWWADFLGPASRARVLMFHLHHPWRTLSMMYWDLKVRAPNRRMNIIGKYDRESGYSAQTQAQSFGWWTAFRSALFRLAPWHILVWFAIVLAMSLRLALLGGIISRIAILSLALSLMAVMEFAISSLSDAGETERHLFLFHVLTDFTILCAAAWVSHSLYQRYSAMRPSGPTAQSEPSRATFNAL